MAYEERLAKAEEEAGIPQEVERQIKLASERGTIVASKKLPMEEEIVDMAVSDKRHMKPIGQAYVKAYAEQRERQGYGGKRRKTRKSKRGSKKTKKRSRR